MGYVTPEFSRSAIDSAAKTLLNKGSSEPELEEADRVLSNWRSSHAFPLNTIFMDLKTKSKKVNPNSLTVQRLKRSKSILGKLTRKSSMRLTQMQDIGGCRSVLKNVGEIEALRKLYKSSQAEHEFISEDDYISTPQKSGYRGVHFIYRYKSKSRKEYNGRLIEIQLRTELQHAWATAVETVGAVLGQSLKSSEGQLEWLNFFKFASSAISTIEKCPSIPNTPTSKRELARSLRKQIAALNVEDILVKYSNALKSTDSVKLKKAGYFLLVLRPEDPTLEIYAYKKSQLDIAHEDYINFEKQLPSFSRHPQLPLFPEFADYSGAQAVLVGAESFKELRKSYPNYYLDTRSFIEAINYFIKTYK